jgi:hypothetical protein
MANDLDPKSDIRQRFSYHPATEVTGPKHDKVRSAYLNMANYIIENIPNSREQALALTALQESMMWCNAAIAYR